MKRLYNIKFENVVKKKVIISVSQINHCALDDIHQKEIRFFLNFAYCTFAKKIKIRKDPKIKPAQPSTAYSLAVSHILSD